jgi:hypothetical protein
MDTEFSEDIKGQLPDLLWEKIQENYSVLTDWDSLNDIVTSALSNWPIDQLIDECNRENVEIPEIENDSDCECLNTGGNDSDCECCENNHYF